jgi:hypothetical protein
MIYKINRIFGFRILDILIVALYPDSGNARLGKLSDSGYGSWNYLFMPSSEALFWLQVIIMALLRLVFIYCISHKKRIAHKVQ